MSSSTAEPRKKGVVERTGGIIFLGTPHKGSSAASYGKIAFNISRFLAAQSVNTKLLRALEQNSESLQRITTTFLETLESNPRIQIWSFSEEKEVRNFGILGMRIVPPDSSKMVHPREQWGTIPANHREMARFSSEHDTGFVRVRSAIKTLVEHAEWEAHGKSPLQTHKEQLGDAY